MADFMYPSIKEKMLSGQFNWLSDSIVAILVASGKYTPSVNHASLLDLPVTARVATSDVLTGRTVVNNVVDADDYLFSNVSGPQVAAVVLAVNSGTEATSWLIAYLDKGVSGLPFNPSDGPAQLAWDNGANKIFAL
jgi:hypothetical protein